MRIIRKSEQKISTCYAENRDVRFLFSGSVQSYDWLVVNPCMVWLGYDSTDCHLPEPELQKIKQLYWELGTRGFTVILKNIRKAWWEESKSSN